MESSPYPPQPVRFSLSIKRKPVKKEIIERYFEFIRRGVSQFLKVQDFQIPKIDVFLVSRRGLRTIQKQAEPCLGVERSEYESVDASRLAEEADALMLSHTDGYVIFLRKPLRSTWYGHDKRLVHEILHIFELHFGMKAGSLAHALEPYDYYVEIKPEHVTEKVLKSAGDKNIMNAARQSNKAVM